MAFFLLTTITILALSYWYIGRRLIHPLPVGTGWKALLWLALAAPFVLPILSMVLRRLDRPLGSETVLPWAIWLGMGFISLILILLVLRDMLVLDIAVFRRVSRFFRRRTADARAPFPESFRLPHPGPNTGNLLLVGLALVLTAWGVYGAHRTPRVVEVSIPITGLPAAFEGFRIVQITDLHVGPTIRRPFAERVVRRVNELAPDLVALTGDLADGSVASLREDVAPFGEIRAPFGKYFITGNHEYYSGADAWIAEVRRLGYDVLLNGRRVIRKGDEAILLAGVTDYSAGHFGSGGASSPRESLRGAPPLETRILLAHQPRSIHQAERLGFDLQISGHTHGGQYFPWRPFVYLQQPFVAGLHRRGDTLVYTSRGTGYWGPPLRIGSPSEITLFILTRAE